MTRWAFSNEHTSWLCLGKLFALVRHPGVALLRKPGCRWSVVKREVCPSAGRDENWAQAHGAPEQSSSLIDSNYGVEMPME